MAEMKTAGVAVTCSEDTAPDGNLSASEVTVWGYPEYLDLWPSQNNSSPLWSASQPIINFS